MFMCGGCWLVTVVDIAVAILMVRVDGRSVGSGGLADWDLLEF
jgi:hypothetical protein